jgi:hypothetical protein
MQMPAARFGGPGGTMADPIMTTQPQIFPVSREAYGDRYDDHLFETYKVYVASHEKISERREGANKFFVTLNTAVVGAIAFFSKAEQRNDTFILIIVAGALAICWFWYRVIRSYDGLNTGKFFVIHALERRLPAAVFEAEWEALGRGLDPERYKPISHLERMVPATFAVVYGVLAILIACRLDWSRFPIG